MGQRIVYNEKQDPENEVTYHLKVRYFSNWDNAIENSEPQRTQYIRRIIDEQFLANIWSRTPNVNRQPHQCPLKTRNIEINPQNSSDKSIRISFMINGNIHNANFLELALKFCLAVFTMVKRHHVHVVSISDSGVLGLIPLPNTEFFLAWMGALFSGTLSVRHFFRECARTASGGLDTWANRVLRYSAVFGDDGNQATQTVLQEAINKGPLRKVDFGNISANMEEIVQRLGGLIEDVDIDNDFSNFQLNGTIDTQLFDFCLSMFDTVTELIIRHKHASRNYLWDAIQAPGPRSGVGFLIAYLGYEFILPGAVGWELAFGYAVIGGGAIVGIVYGLTVLAKIWKLAVSWWTKRGSPKEVLETCLVTLANILRFYFLLSTRPAESTTIAADLANWVTEELAQDGPSAELLGIVDFGDPNSPDFVGNLHRRLVAYLHHQRAMVTKVAEDLKSYM